VLELKISREMYLKIVIIFFFVYTAKIE